MLIVQATYLGVYEIGDPRINGSVSACWSPPPPPHKLSPLHRTPPPPPPPHHGIRPPPNPKPLPKP